MSPWWQLLELLFRYYRNSSSSNCHQGDTALCGQVERAERYWLVRSVQHIWKLGTRHLRVGRFHEIYGCPIFEWVVKFSEIIIKGHGVWPGAIMLNRVKFVFDSCVFDDSSLLIVSALCSMFLVYMLQWNAISTIITFFCAAFPGQSTGCFELLFKIRLSLSVSIITMNCSTHPLHTLAYHNPDLVKTESPPLHTTPLFYFCRIDRVGSILSLTPISSKWVTTTDSNTL